MKEKSKLTQISNVASLRHQTLTITYCQYIFIDDVVVLFNKLEFQL